ncbi:MAG: SMP-30/gluconolactonase/LRE family protein [Novosphingobium sp.]|nr:SMP-30/gluconolactonase/LRE family protein [Novosphingobium sp.]
MAGDGMDRRHAIAALLAAGISGWMSDGAWAISLLPPAAFEPVLDKIEGAEGLATAPDGTLAFSCSNAAAGFLRPDGTVEYVGEAIATGGMAFDGQGRLIVASVGALHGREGPLRRIDPATGKVETLVSELEGRRLVASNCPVVARDGTIYCSHSGWSVGNIGTTLAEGFIYSVTPDGEARIVVSGLRGANGLCLDAGDRRLCAALTAVGRVAAWDIGPYGGLHEQGYVGPVLGDVVDDQKAGEIRALPGEERGATGYCDGIAFDSAGTLYVTLPFANRIVTIDRHGRLATLVHDPEGRRIDFPTNLAFGGPGLRDLYIVSRGAGAIVKARMPYPGLPAANWPLR